MNLLVQPSNSFNVPLEETALSKARIAVVPTAQTTSFILFALLIISTASASIVISSAIHFMLR